MDDNRTIPLKSSNSFMHGAVILIAANLIVKVIGALFRIPLTNLIGDVGMGYFQTAYGMYQMLFVLSTAGLPVAVSKLVSENAAVGNYADVKRIFNISLISFMFIGLAGSLVMMFGAEGFAKMANNDKAMYCVLAISPSIFFVAIMSTFRGFFQGLSNMVPTALSQVVEALSKLVIGFVVALMVMKAGETLEIAAAGAVTGITIGSLLGALVMWRYYKKSKYIKEINRRAKAGRARPGKKIFIQLIKIAVPVTIGASVMSVTNLIDLLLVMNRLGDAGFTQDQANALYGTYSSMSVTLFSLPSSIVVSIGISLLPVISAAYATRNRTKLNSSISSGLRIGVLIAMPCAVGLAALSEPILSLLFFAQLDAVKVAAPLLTSLGAAVLFVSMVSLTNSMLQAVGRANIPVFTMLLGGCIKLITNYILVGNPDINISGAPIGTTLCYGTIMVLNVIFLLKTTHIRINFLDLLIKPLVSASAMGIGAVVIYNVLSSITGNSIATVASVIVAAIIYFFMLIVLRGIVREDMLIMPKGTKIVKMMDRFGWLPAEKKNREL